MRQKDDEVGVLFWENICGFSRVDASGCTLSISIRGKTDFQEHTHILRVFTSPDNVDKVKISFDGWSQTLDTAGSSNEEQYIDYYISTTLVNMYPNSWNDTGKWSVTGPGYCIGGGAGGGGGGSW